MQIYGSNILTLDFINNFAMVNGEDYCVDKDLTPNRTSVFGQYGGPLTFSRGSHATVTDKTGRLTYAPNNLFLQSGWAGAVSGTPGTAPTSWTFSISGGSLTVTPSALGNRLTFTTTTSARHFIYQNVVASAFTSYLFSVNVVDNPDSVVISRIIGGSQAPTGTVSTYYLNGVSVPGSTIAPNNSRISILYQIAATAGTLVQRIGMGTEGNALGSVTLEYPQMETVTYQTVPVAYIPTTTAAYYGPRFDYDPTTYLPKGLLIEEQRTNLETYSDQFDNAIWTTSLATISANVIASPDGTTNADKLVSYTSSGVHTVYSGSISLATATTYTMTVYAKAAGYNWIRMISTNGTAWGGTAPNAYYNVSTGAVGTVSTGSTASIVNVGNGWYRCILTTPVTTTTATIGMQFTTTNADNTNSITGDGISGAYFWGAQLEVGAFATSYIPTVASTVTRNFDNCSIVGSNFAGWYNQQQGSFVCNADSNANISTNVYSPFTVSDGTVSNHIRGYIYNGKWGASCTIENSVQFELNQAGSYVPNVPAKLVVSYNNNDFAISVNGASTLTDTSGTVPVFDRLNIGSRLSSFSHLNGHIRSIQYYPQRLPNATLQSLTAPPATTSLSLDFINQSYTVGA